MICRQGITDYIQHGNRTLENPRGINLWSALPVVCSAVNSQKCFFHGRKYRVLNMIHKIWDKAHKMKNTCRNHIFPPSAIHWNKGRSNLDTDFTSLRKFEVLDREENIFYSFTGVGSGTCFCFLVYVPILCHFFIFCFFLIEKIVLGSARKLFVLIVFWLVTWIY